jgi:small-conductance mechanosensitive channel
MGLLSLPQSGLRREISRLNAFLLATFLTLSVALAVDTPPDAPLVIGNRTIHVFRATLGAFSPLERADGARQRILKALTEPGEGWTSVRVADQGVLVEIDGKPMFTIATGDANSLSGETPTDLANAASRVLQKTWSEARERSDPRAAWIATMKVVLAALVIATTLVAIWKLSRVVRAVVTRRLARRLTSNPVAGVGSKISALSLSIASRSCVLLAWLLSLLVVFIFLTYSLDQFAFTRPMGEGLLHSFQSLLLQMLNAVGAALPGIFIAVIIFLVAWIATQISAEFFGNVAEGKAKLGMLDAHTAPATRRIANASLWLFALAMAYPYLPGAQTEAFKGLTVILGIMVSIGASGVIGQIASGVILVYTRALSVGEYVRIQECEGTVSDLGLFVTRLRTGMGEEIALPNSVVLANVTRNYSRVAPGTGFVLDTTITIGYDVPWRQVHAMLLEAAGTIPEIGPEPAPYVVQTALSDFYVAYKLVVYVSAAQPAKRALVTSDLYAAIQDAFNKYGVQIMSPNYFEDPEKPKIVPESEWFAAPAKRHSR